MTRRTGAAGAAVVDFVFVTVLVVALFLLVLQVGLVLHVRNVLVSSAAEEPDTPPTPTVRRVTGSRGRSRPWRRRSRHRSRIG